MKFLRDVILIGAASHTVEATITHSTSLNCGQCIKGGFVFCTKGAHRSGHESNRMPVSTCCADNTCSEVSNAEYQCSSLFTDGTYAKTMCPYRNEACGAKTTFEYTEEGNLKPEDISVAKLTDGETCTYWVKSKCGAPAFKYKSGAKTNIEVKYLEMKTEKMTLADVGTTAETSPEKGLMARNSELGDGGSQAMVQSTPG